MERLSNNLPLPNQLANGNLKVSGLGLQLSTATHCFSLHSITLVVLHHLSPVTTFHQSVYSRIELLLVSYLQSYWHLGLLITTSYFLFACFPLTTVIRTYGFNFVIVCICMYAYMCVYMCAVYIYVYTLYTYILKYQSLI